MNRPPTASVETLPTWTELEVMPVWSLNALDGIFELPEPPPPEVVDDDDVVELQATAVAAVSSSTPAVARDDFHEPERTDPPRSLSLCRSTGGTCHPGPIE